MKMLVVWPLALAYSAAFAQEGKPAEMTTQELAVWAAFEA